MLWLLTPYAPLQENTRSELEECRRVEEECNERLRSATESATAAAGHLCAARDGAAAAVAGEGPETDCMVQYVGVGQKGATGAKVGGGLAGLAGLAGRRARPPPSDPPLIFHCSLIAGRPLVDAAHAAPSLGFELDETLTVCGLEPRSAAHAAGVLAGDVVTAINGTELRRPTRRWLCGLPPLAAVLRDLHLVEGERVELTLRRPLEVHMDAVMRRTLDDPALRDTVPPDSPRLLPRDRSGAAERRTAWEAAGRPRPRHPVRTAVRVRHGAM